jgi:beta-glucosidase
VVILNIGGVIETNSWKHLADAILVAWQPGQEAGNAVADVISGKASPSGKLPMTFPIAYADSPSATTFPGIELNIEDKSEPNLIMGKPAETTYEEDIFVGYRYFDSFSKPTSYPFGFGLSYTTFKYSNMSITPFSNGKLKASCTVANTGKTSGKEVVQLYISAKNSQQVRPSKELKAFQKTKLLKKGENELVDFTVNLSDLASYNTEKAAWIVEKGTYDIILATSSDSKNALRKTISIDTDTVVSKVTNRLTPTKPIRTILQKATNN